jgi:mevalonate kinase
MKPIFETYSQGKLLMSGEYFVLYGAKALALPLKYGQWLSITPSNNININWTSYYSNEIWFKATFNCNLEIIDTTDKSKASVIAGILKTALSMTNHPSLQSIDIETVLDFNPNWGWGSSSTLINNIAKWLNINPYQLSSATLGGSNYDIACANANQPIYYQINDNQSLIIPTAFNPPFKSQLYFLYLGNKQDSRQSVSKLLKDTPPTKSQLNEISQISDAMTQCSQLIDFEKLMTEHEILVASLIQQIPVKQALFGDFAGNIKSLGAWGGDFVMVTSNLSRSEILQWFQTKGYPVLFSLDEIALNT